MRKAKIELHSTYLKETLSLSNLKSILYKNSIYITNSKRLKNE